MKGFKIIGRSGLEDDIDKLEKEREKIISEDKEVEKAKKAYATTSDKLKALHKKQKEFESTADKIRGGKATRNLKRDLTKISKQISATRAELFLKKEELNEEIRGVEKSDKVKDIDRDVKKHRDNKLNIETKLAERDKLKSTMLTQAGVVMTIASPIKVAIDFQNAMIEVKSVVSFDKVADFKSFSEKILKLSTTIPKTTNELAKTSIVVGKMGVKQENLALFTEKLTRMSDALKITIPEAGETIVKLKSLYSLNINEAYSMADAINHISNKFMVKPKSITDTLSGTNASTKKFGLDRYSSMALSSTFLSTGESSASATSGVNTLLEKLSSISDTKKFDFKTRKSFVDALGIKNTKSFVGKIKSDPQKQLTKFLTAMSEIKEEKKRVSLVTKMFGKKDTSSILKVISSLERYKSIQKELQDKSSFENSIKEESDKLYSSTDAKLTKLQNAFNRMGVSFGKLLLPKLNWALDKFIEGMDYISNLAQDNPKVAKWLMATAVAIAGITVAATALAFVISGLSLIFSGIGIGMAALVGVVIAAGVAIVVWRDEIGEALSSVGAYFSEKLESFKSLFSNISWSSIGTGLVASMFPIASIFGILTKPFTAIVDFIREYFFEGLSLKDAGSRAINGFIDGFKNGFKKAVKVLTSVKDSITSIFSFGDDEEKKKTKVAKLATNQTSNNSTKTSKEDGFLSSLSWKKLKFWEDEKKEETKVAKLATNSTSNNSTKISKEERFLSGLSWKKLKFWEDEKKEKTNIAKLATTKNSKLSINNTSYKPNNTNNISSKVSVPVAENLIASNNKRVVTITGESSKNSTTTTTNKNVTVNVTLPNGTNATEENLRQIKVAVKAGMGEAGLYDYADNNIA